MLFQQDSESDDVDESQKRNVEFVIANGYSTKPLKFLKNTQRDGVVCMRANLQAMGL